MTIFKFKTDQNGKEYFDPIKCQNRLMIWSYSQKVSTLKQKKESNQQQIWFPFLAVFSPLIASFTRKKERGIESIMAPEASVSPLRRRPDNSDIMGKIIWSNIEIDVKINNYISLTWYPYYISCITITSPWVKHITYSIENLTISKKSRASLESANTTHCPILECFLSKLYWFLKTIHIGIMQHLLVSS